MKSLVAIVLAVGASLASAATIDRMNTATFGHYAQNHRADGTFMVFSKADNYELSDGSNWEAGAGWHPNTYATLASVTSSGDTVTYTFNAPSSGLLFQNTDYDSGNHSAQGQLGLPATLSIVATLGGTTGVLSGYTQIISNQATWYGEPRFNYYSAPVGSFVYFEQTFFLLNATFSLDLFSHDFAYNEVGFVDFTRTQPVPEPGTIVLSLVGLGLVGLRFSRKQA